jgi:L-seryl-tRNA(Ser) seleniumtransferase
MSSDPASRPASPTRRDIPAVHRLVEHVERTGRGDGTARALVVEAARATLDEYREEMAREGAGAPRASIEALAQRVVARLERERRPPLVPAINASGIIIHTGLGRAPWPEAAVQAAADVARGYAPVELDLASGERGLRSTIVRDLLTRLTGAESATVVNNNAAALLLVLSALARGRSVIVSRGELIEIGGSFRLPEVMAAGGALLREVGTTNRTRLSDYRGAIDETTAALLKVHTSNYRIEGFTETVPLTELVGLGREHDVSVIHDIGSGLLVRDEGAALPADEPAAAESVEAGADLVLFSGDKLLSGPQAGLIIGRADLVARIERHPMMRALRVDKVTLAALAATLQVHRDRVRAAREVPVRVLIATPLVELEARARSLVERLRTLERAATFECCPARAYIGGGSVPTQALESLAVVVRSRTMSEDELARRLRCGAPAIVPRIGDGAVWLDLRTVLPWQDDVLLEGLRRALEA